MTKGQARARSWAFELWLLALSLSSLIHAGLADYEQREWTGQRAWLISSALALLGAVYVRRALSHPNVALISPFSSWRGPALQLASWGPSCALLSIVSHKLYTLLALRDVLTQSALLLTFALIGLLGERRAEAQGCLRGRALRAACAVTALTYAAAALHKLNVTFLSSPTSCALHGLELSLELMGLPWPEPPELPLAWCSALVATLYRALASPELTGSLIIFVELALALGLWRGRAWVWPLGVAFHLPLTLTIAPSFGAVMLCGYLASTLSLSRGAERSLASRLFGELESKRAHLGWRALALTLSGLLAASSPLAGALKAGLMSLSAWWGWLVGGTQRLQIERSRGALAVIITLYAGHALSPYLGLEVQHSGAMLSNLRVDPPCYNSLIMPPLGWDPYIRVDEARFGSVERPERVRALKAQLWGWAALNTMRRNWCSPTTRPLMMSGTWGGEPFELQDLCAPDGLETLKAQHPIKTSLPSAWQRLQKNLSRRCDQPCLH